MGPFSVTIFWCSSMGPRSRWHFQQLGTGAPLILRLDNFCRDGWDEAQS